MSVLSIQSQVAFGHVGLAAARFPLQRLGFEVWDLPTTLLSNHKGYSTHYGQNCEADLFAGLFRGMKQRDDFQACQAVLSGYLASKGLAEQTRKIVEQVKEKTPTSLYFCDPVIGDQNRPFYVPEDLAAYIKTDLLPLADVIAPNQTELAYLSGRAQETIEDALFACDDLRGRGPQTILVTSVPASLEDRPALSTLVVSDQGAWAVTVPQLPLLAKGTGDAFSALYLAHILRGETSVNALEISVATLHGIIDDTVRHDRTELRLIAAQSEYLHPSFYFEAKRIG